MLLITVSRRNAALDAHLMIDDCNSFESSDKEHRKLFYEKTVGKGEMERRETERDHS